MFKHHFNNFIGKAIDWLFRVTTIERYLLKSSASLLLLLFAAPHLLLAILGVFDISLDTPFFKIESTFNELDLYLFGASCIPGFAGICMILFNFCEEKSLNLKRKIVVIEGRGLRDIKNKPLDSYRHLFPKGSVETNHLNLRNNLDGIIVAPEKAIEKIMSCHNSLLQKTDSGDLENTQIFYGGLCPVPYTFLTGVLLDDEREINVLDWDRQSEAWKPLDDPDDGANFIVQGVDVLDSKTPNVVMAISFSYPVDVENIKTTFDYPIVHLKLDEINSSNHWSIAKQKRLASEFFEIVKMLSGQGVKHIHLVLAAPNSTVFNFGARYDKRNLPNITVHQFQQTSEKKYPWGITMPVGTLEQPQVRQN